MKIRLNESGALASFVAIGVVLVLVAGGLLYWVNHKGSVETETPAPVATEPNSSNDQSNNDREDEPSAAPSNEPAAPEAVPAPVASPVESAAPVVTQLSETGPADTALQLLMAGLLAAFVAAFVRSRKLRSSL
jgi:cytoskeletal protein RodZ